MPDRRVILPMPTGPHPVGTTAPTWPGAAGPELPDGRDDLPHQHALHVRYPAEPSDKAATGPYIPDRALIEAMKAAAYLDLAPEILDAWARIRAHATPEAPIVASPDRLPLLLFGHGFGVSRLNYTSIAEDLASHGYLVAAADHVHTGFAVSSDGRLLAPSDDPEHHTPDARVDATARETSAILDALLDSHGAAGQFADRIARDRIGVLGHSIGGAAALETARADPRFKAAADLDGSAFGTVATTGLGCPALVVLNQPTFTDEQFVARGGSRDGLRAMGLERDREWADLIAKRATPVQIVKVRGTTHLSFSDLPLIVPDALMRAEGAVLPPRRILELTSRVLRAFFGRYLAGAAEALDAVVRSYPEASLRTYGD